MNVDNKRIKKVGGVQNKAWWGVRLTMELPIYCQFSNRCKGMGVTLLTSEKDYNDGTDEGGVRFCPTVKMATSRNAASPKSVNTLMREWHALDKQD